MNKFYHFISRTRKTLSLALLGITLPGANTIHHTYGICYQNTTPCSSESIMYSSSSNSGDINLQTSNKSKRKSDRFTKVN